MEYDNSNTFVLDQFKKIDNIDYLINNMKSTSRAFLQIINSLYKGEPKLKDREVFIESLNMRILIAMNSIIKLTEGIYLETNTQKSTIRIIDFPSINILARSIIESFLTLEYLFYNDLKEDEKEFRFLVWRVSGYKSRQNFFQENDRKKIKKDIDKKLNSELEEIEKLLLEIEKSPYYNKLNKQKLWKLDNYGIPRLNSWSTLLELSMLQTQMFQQSYKLYSNYAHSEFISLIQINESDVYNVDSINNTLHLKNALRFVFSISCVAVVQLKEKFNYTKNVYGELEAFQKNIIEFWNLFAIGKLDGFTMAN
ncbi:DUF5677 domain-containing protein [uncultured Chryseobacterium sp.]|uniref:DUF5677 domain-containing protein n=1 Tax=uncultured Chryseobacterium sp. TaxID=259322 RepID=UPI0025FEF282|nr:DUF5677 domain-containing protein [uncultured Chryseobacterium sp.]